MIKRPNQISKRNSDNKICFMYDSMTKHSSKEFGKYQNIFTLSPNSKNSERLRDKHLSLKPKSELTENVSDVRIQQSNILSMKEAGDNLMQNANKKINAIPFSENFETQILHEFPSNTIEENNGIPEENVSSDVFKNATEQTEVTDDDHERIADLKNNIFPNFFEKPRCVNEEIEHNENLYGGEQKKCNIKNILLEDNKSLLSSKNIKNTLTLLKCLSKTKLPLDCVIKPLKESLSDSSISSRCYRAFQILPFIGQKQKKKCNRDHKPIIQRLIRCSHETHETYDWKSDVEMYRELMYRYRCSPKCVIPLIKDTLRKRIEILYLKEHLNECKQMQKYEMNERMRIIELKEFIEKLFAQWRKDLSKLSFDKSSSIEQYYNETSKLKRQLEDVQKRFTRINLDIVFLENDWVRRTILQNFQYLIMKNSWREKYDWIHRKNDSDELESYTESIKKRQFINIRERGRDDAWAIKEYYENVYLPNKRPIMIVFPNAKKFWNGIIKLRIRTFICLLEMHFALQTLTDLEFNINKFKKSSMKFLNLKTIYVNQKIGKKYFMTERVKKLQQYTMELFDKPLRNAIGNTKLRNIQAITDVIYDYVMLMVSNKSENTSKSSMEFIDKLNKIHSIMMNLLEQVDKLPSERREKIEENYRKRCTYEKAKSHKAVLIEKRLNANIEEVKKNLLPPYKKPLHKKNLPNYLLLKQKKKKKIEPKSTQSRLTDHSSIQENYLIPDNERSEKKTITDAFDTFLSMSDFKLDKNFVTNIEKRDGPEESRFKYKEFLPIVYEQMDAWKAIKKQKTRKRK